MTESFRIYLRPFSVIMLTVALLSTTFAPILAQEATPVIETPVATESPTPESTPDSRQEDAKGDEEEESSESSDTGGKSTGRIESNSGLIQPLVDVGGSVIYVESTTPESCGSNGWIFAVDNIDPTITFVTMKFSDGTVLSGSIDSSRAQARVLSHTQYMLVDAWIHSELSDSTATLRLAAGPCNEPIPDGKVYDAVFSLFLYGATPGAGAFDKISWTLTNEESVQVSSGSLVGLDNLTIPGLSNGRYTISFTDSTNRIKDLEIEFVIDDQAPAISAIFYRSTGNIPLVVMPRTSQAGTIQDASVRVVSEDGSIDRTKLTGSDGRADFGALPNGSYLIVTTHDSYASMYLTHRLYGSSTTLYFTMNPLAERNIRGFVADITTNESISDATITLSLSHPLAEDVVGTSDDDGNYSLGVHNDIWYVTVSAPGYLPTSAQLNMRDENIVFNALLDPVPAETENITLQVNTSDSGSVANSTYAIKRGEFVAFSGPLTESGTVALGELDVGTVYEVTIRDTPAAYQPKTEFFTVTSGVSTWTMTLIPGVPTTQGVTLQVGTSDSGSPAGATYSIMQGTVEAFSGTLDASGIVVLGELPIGAEFSVFINGTNQGYEQRTVDFTVTTGEPLWNITMAPLPPTTQAITLQVNTGDSGSPAGATYLVMQGTTEAFAGTLDASGTVALGDLTPGTDYDVSITGAPAGYLDISDSFTVTLEEGTWSISLQPIPMQNVTVQVLTSDQGSPAGLPYTYSLNNGPIQSGTLDSTGMVPLGELMSGTRVDFWIDATGTVYNSHHLLFTVNMQQPTRPVTLYRYGLPIALNVSTSDAGSPAGARYVVTRGKSEILRGTLDATGTADFGDLQPGVEYKVSITGGPAGYLDQSALFIVTQGEETWRMTLQPIPTTTITLNVATSDGGSPEGATFSITETLLLASGPSFTGATRLQIAPTPITGTLPEDGTAILGDLVIGNSYTLTITAEAIGYADQSSIFTVDADSTAWLITLQALQPVGTESPSPTPTPTPSPSPTATPSPSPSPTATQPPTEVPATPAAGTPTEAVDTQSPDTVTGLPSTGTGQGAMANILYAVAGAITLVLAAGLALNRGKQRG